MQLKLKKDENIFKTIYIKNKFNKTIIYYSTSLNITPKF